MQGMWSHYMWLYGDFAASYVVRWDTPRSIIANHSLHAVEAWPRHLPGEDLPPGIGPPDKAIAWILDVTVQDPGRNQEQAIPSDGLVPVRIENNAVAVTFALSAGLHTHVGGLINIFWWS